LHGEDGNALLEFVYLSVILMVPLVYLLLAVFSVQAAAFGVTEAARQAGRAFATAGDPATGYQRAQEAVRLALSDQHIDADVVPELTCSPAPCDLAPGQRVVTSVAYTVQLPFVGGIFGKGHAGIPVRGRHVEVVDRFKQAAP
jgi:Flp pilus assembly protein TadG